MEEFQNQCSYKVARTQKEHIPYNTINKSAINVVQLNTPIQKGDINVKCGNLIGDVIPKQLAFYIIQTSLCKSRVSQ